MTWLSSLFGRKKSWWNHPADVTEVLVMEDGRSNMAQNEEARIEREKRAAQQKQIIWSKQNDEYRSFGGGYGGYVYRKDAVRYLGENRFLLETTYDGDKWQQTELLRSKEEVERWIALHGGADDLDKIKWPQEA